MIKEIIDEIEASMLAYLINALYFKGTWTYAFDAAHSYDDTFYPDFEQERTVNYMTQTETFLIQKQSFPELPHSRMGTRLIPWLSSCQRRSYCKTGYVPGDDTGNLAGRYQRFGE